MLVERVEGNVQAVVGLPLAAIPALLRRIGLLLKAEDSRLTIAPRHRTEGNPDNRCLKAWRVQRGHCGGAGDPGRDVGGVRHRSALRPADLPGASPPLLLLPGRPAVRLLRGFAGASRPRTLAQQPRATLDAPTSALVPDRDRRATD